MQHQHRKRNPTRHEQLDVRQVREDVGTERVEDCAGGGRSRVSSEIAQQQTRAEIGGRETEKQDDIQREPRIAGQPVRRDADDPRQDVRFRISERELVRMKDVGVEEMKRIRDDRPRDPRNVPDAVLPVCVGGQRASEVAQVRGKRPRHQDRKGKSGRGHEQEFARARDGAGRFPHVELRSL